MSQKFEREDFKAAAAGIEREEEVGKEKHLTPACGGRRVRHSSSNQ